MNRAILGGAVILGGLAAVVGGCGAAGAESGAAGSVSGAGIGGGQGTAVREADVPARDRWASPFAVASSGNPTPVEPRQVIVAWADPAIMAGVTEQSAIEAAIRAGEPTVAGGAADPERAEGGDRFLPPEGASAEPGERSLPPEEAGAEPRRVVLEGEPIGDVGLRVHVVEAGESWRMIADEYRVSITDLLDANPRVDRVRPPVGEELVIPRD